MLNGSNDVLVPAKEKVNDSDDSDDSDEEKEGEGEEGEEEQEEEEAAGAAAAQKELEAQQSDWKSSRQGWVMGGSGLDAKYASGL